MHKSIKFIIIAFIFGACTKQVTTVPTTVPTSTSINYTEVVNSFTDKLKSISKVVFLIQNGTNSVNAYSISDIGKGKNVGIEKVENDPNFKAFGSSGEGSISVEIEADKNSSNLNFCTNAANKLKISPQGDIVFSNFDFDPSIISTATNCYFKVQFGVREEKFDLLFNRPFYEWLNDKTAVLANQSATIINTTITDLKDVKEIVATNKNLLDISFISGMTAISNLNLSSNNIQNLPEYVFFELNNLDKLDISQNGLINQLLGPNNFQGLKSLTDLNLSQNNTSFNDFTFVFTPKLINLDLSRNRINNLKNNPFMVLKSLENLDLSQNNISDIQTLSFIGLVSLKSLKLSDNKISSLDYLSELSSLQLLDLSNNSISKIGYEDFSLLTNLTNLNLSANSIIKIKSEYFNKLNNLISLNLSDNTINLIEGNSFAGLASLQTLNLSDNLISYIEDNSFLGLESLQTLDLSNNIISQIKTNAFSDLANLWTLNLSYNSISYIDDNSFEGLASLQTLNLSNNIISQIKKDSFSNLADLASLNLSDNTIDSIADNSFIQLVKEKYITLDLDLTNNTINEVQYSYFGIDESSLNCQASAKSIIINYLTVNGISACPTTLH